MNSRSTSPDEHELRSKNKDITPLLNSQINPQFQAIIELEETPNQQISQNIGVISSSNISAPLHGPGIFFDMQKGEQFMKLESYQKMQSKLRSSSQCQFNGTKTSNFSIPISQRSNPTTRGRYSKSSHLDGLPQGSTVLFSPFEYLSYASKISESRENLLSGLQQLGYANTDQLNGKPIKDVISRTEDIINKSYSLKYLGVIDGNMGVLSKRIKIKQDQNPYQKHHNQFKHNMHSKEYQLQQGQLRSQRQYVSQNPEQRLSNISCVPSTYRPDLYNSYLITSYSLPKSLKPVVQKRDQFIVDEKLRLSAWHNEQLKSESNLLLPLDNAIGNSSISIQQLDSHRTNKSDQFLDEQQQQQQQEQQLNINENSKNNSLSENHKNNSQTLLSTQLLSTQALHGSSQFNDAAVSTSIQNLISSRLNGTFKKNNQKIKQLQQQQTSREFFIQNTFTQPQLQHFLPGIHSPDSQQQLALNNQQPIINPSFTNQMEQNYPQSYSRLLNKIQSQQQQQLKLKSKNQHGIQGKLEDISNHKDSAVGNLETQDLSSPGSQEQIVKDTNDFHKNIDISRKQSEGFIDDQANLTLKHNRSQGQIQQTLKYTQNEQLQNRFDRISKLLQQNKQKTVFS